MQVGPNTDRPGLAIESFASRQRGFYIGFYIPPLAHRPRSYMLYSCTLLITYLLLTYLYVIEHTFVSYHTQLLIPVLVFPVTQLVRNAAAR